MESTKKIAFVSDFDGTITKDDFFSMVVNKYFKNGGLEPWYRYLDGKITHFDALNQIFSSIRDSKTKVDELVSQIHIEEYFFKVVDLCHQNAIPMYIVSAGCDYYINQVIGEVIEANDIKLITNKGVFSDGEGLKMIALPEDSEYFYIETGVSKVNVVNNLKKQGYFVVFAGDGLPDFEAAIASDIIFARGMLFDKCQQKNVETQPFNDYEDIYNYFEKAVKDNALSS